MLNTLYPPATPNPPTRQLTAHILASQRNAFFRYITGVEQNGRGILKNLEHQSKRPGDVNGWAVVRDTVDKYLRTANGIIEESLEVTGPEHFTPEAESFRRNERRMDSGFAFTSSNRPPTGNSTHGGNGATPTNKPLPNSPPHFTKSHSTPITPRKRGTTLEKIAREFRNLRNRNDVKELPHSRTRVSPELEFNNNSTKEPSKSRSLRKMKSTSSIAREKARHSRSGSDEPMPDFDMDARRRQMIMEAKREKENRAHKEKTDFGVTLSRGGRSFELAT